MTSVNNERDTNWPKKKKYIEEHKERNREGRSEFTYYTHDVYPSFRVGVFNQFQTNWYVVAKKI